MLQMCEGQVFSSINKKPSLMCNDPVIYGKNLQKHLQINTFKENEGTLFHVSVSYDSSLPIRYRD